MTRDELVKLHSEKRQEWLSLQAGPDWKQRNAIYDEMARLSLAIDQLDGVR